VWNVAEIYFVVDVGEYAYLWTSRRGWGVGNERWLETRAECHLITEYRFVYSNEFDGKTGSESSVLCPFL